MTIDAFSVWSAKGDVSHLNMLVEEYLRRLAELVGIFAERMIKVIKANGAYLEKLTGDKFDFEKYIGIGADGGVDFSEGEYNSDDIPYEVIDTDSEKDEQ